jgi:hypothetical protein
MAATHTARERDSKSLNTDSESAAACSCSFHLSSGDVMVSAGTDVSDSNSGNCGVSSDDQVFARFGGHHYADTYAERA